MTLYPSAPPAGEQDESCDWRALTLGLAALMSQPREPTHDSLTEVAHQLKTPVGILRAHAARFQLHASGQPRAAAAHEVARRIVEQADLMSGWVSAMLEVQRIRLGKLSLSMSWFDLADLAQSCIDDIATTAGWSAVDWTADLTSGATIYADRARLAHAITDLLNWAGRSSPASPPALQLAIREWFDGRSRAVLRITPATCEPSWDDVQHPCAAEADIDLDLYVARELIRLHGGELWIDACGAAVLVVPLDFSPRSHAVLAPSGRSSAER
jgi:K+-sensing histidine kinase KdpD